MFAISRIPRHVAFAVACGAAFCSGPFASAALYLVDVGPLGSDGVATSAKVTSPTNSVTNGEYFNNLTTPAANSSVLTTNPTVSNIVSSTNVASSISLTASNFQAAGLKAGPENSPTTLLGALDVVTATEDYFYVQAQTGVLTISGLDPTMTYDLGLFGSRVTDVSTVRTTVYSVTDAAGLHSATLQTSGPGSSPTSTVYGNDSGIALLTGLTPTSAGVISLSVSSLFPTSPYGYLNALTITSVPEPMSLGLLGLGGAALLRRRR